MSYMNFVLNFVTQTPGLAILLAVMAIQFVIKRIPRRS